MDPSIQRSSCLLLCPHNPHSEQHCAPTFTSSGGAEASHQPHISRLKQAWRTPSMTPYLFQELNMPINDAQVASAVPMGQLEVPEKG